MDKADLLDRVRRTNEKGFQENKPALRARIQETVEEFLARGGEVNDLSPRGKDPLPSREAGRGTGFPKGDITT
jgi:hypothetical protein